MDHKRRHFKFSKYDIPVGVVIQYVNNTTIEATVVDYSYISYKGVTTSTSVLTQELLESESSVR